MKRLACVLASVFCIVTIGLTHAQGPVDIFDGSTSSFEKSQPERSNFNVGDWGVAEQVGAATYTYPIQVPRGRNGMQPRLALRYSSHGPIRGGLAVGWTLDLPSIRVDRSLGNTGGLRFRMSLGEATGRLVEVNDDSPFNPGQGKTYRAEFDHAFTRVIRVMPGGTHPELRGWVALTPDGVQHFFDESELPTTFQETRWHLTREVDPFGNSIRYFWSPIFEDGTPGNRIVDVTLDRIEYASNEAAGLGPYAKIEFQYFPEIESCFGSKIPFGAAHQNNLGKAMKGYLEGSRRLTKISVFVSDFPESGWRLSREVTLRYNLDTPGPLEGKCDLMLQGLLLDTRFRYLREIRETGFDFGGTPTTLPPIEFRYGRTERENNLNFKHTLQREFDHVGTKEGALASLQDINDDGINDRVQVDVNAPICTLRWQRGHFGGTLGNSKELLEQFGELNHCTLNGGFRVEQLSPQETKEEQISFHFQVFGRAAAPVRHEKRFGWRPPHALEVADPQAHRRDLAATGPAGQRGATSARGVEPSRRGH